MSINYNKYPLVTVYTCVYNGERTIHRVFNSMKNIKYPNIEHVIINDGSKDNTDKMICDYIEEVSYPVKYIKKENGGKHTALNIAWDIAEGFFMIQLDADDELLPHSISYLVNQYYSIPQNVRSEYWCVHGRCVTQNNEFVGDRYPDNINDNYWKNASKLAGKCSGEKIGLQRRDYMKGYRFPEIKGLSHISESIVWAQINKKYGTWYTNEVVRIYYVGEGGNLSDIKKTRKQFGPATFTRKWKIMNEKFYGKSFKNLLLYSILYFVSDKRYRKHNKYLQDIKNHRLVLKLISPFCFLLAFDFPFIRKLQYGFPYCNIV